MTTKQNPIESRALAVPTGLVAITTWKYSQLFCCCLTTKTEIAKVAESRYRFVARCDFLVPRHCEKLLNLEASSLNWQHCITNIINR